MKTDYAIIHKNWNGTHGAKSPPHHASSRSFEREHHLYVMEMEFVHHIRVMNYLE